MKFSSSFFTLNDVSTGQFGKTVQVSRVGMIAMQFNMTLSRGFLKGKYHGVFDLLLKMVK